MRLEGHVAIVTGSGRGVGRAIALALAEEGADLVVLSRRLHEVEETAVQARILGRRALALQVDVADMNAVEAMVKQCLQEFGRVDVLVNNAAIQGPIGPLMENNVEDWHRTIAVNLLGVFHCCRAVLPYMMKQRRGKIINLSGGGATSPRPHFSAYASSKAAVVRLTETLAREVQHFNIQVNAIAPGGVYTRMTEEVLSVGDVAGYSEWREAQRVQVEGASAKEGAALAVFLASSESDGLTGRLISAVWDDWRSIAGRVDQIMGSELYTLRRVVE